VDEAFACYRLDLAARALYEFTWNEFCDWYLELSKPVLQSEDSSAAERRATRRTLVEVLEALLRLMHPIMPFITEEIWRRVAPLAGVGGDTIMRQPYPVAGEWIEDDEAERELEWIKGFVLGIRQIRGEMNISPGRALPVILQDAGDSDLLCAERHGRFLTRMVRLGDIRRLGADETPPPSAAVLLGTMRILVPMEGLIDVAAELERLQRQREKLLADLGKAEKKLSNDSFVNNAPADVVEKERQRVLDFGGAIGKIDEQLEVMRELA
jgi:valyl-tRNA synthetase